MKISRKWLQTYFEKNLPGAEVLADALTFHAFEIESVEDDPGKSGVVIPGPDILDVKVTPNRGHDALSHRAIAKELSAILNLPFNTKNDPFTRPINLSKKTDAVTVSIQDANLCKRYIAGYIKGVKVGPSPDWLRQSLESIGQKSINNVVDATNLVMFSTGQPLHAFDAGQLKAESGIYAIGVRLAKDGEKMRALDDKEYTLAKTNLVITDENSENAIGIAGVKGGKPAGITEATTDIIIESANFDGVSVRKTSQSLQLRTDASERFQQVISPELAAIGMQQAVELITRLAGGEVVGFVDQYPTPQKARSVSVTLVQVNASLGTTLIARDISDVFTRLGFSFKEANDEFTVTPSFERLDIEIAEDLIEEVGRIVGYDKVLNIVLPSLSHAPEVNTNFASAEKVREELTAKGYSEVLTSVFAESGERAVANKVGGEKPFLRTTLVDGLKDAYERNLRNKDLLGLSEIKLLEIGTVWKKGKEVVMLGTADAKGVKESPLEIEKLDAYEKLPTSSLERYQSFSRFPSISRDVSFWAPQGTSTEEGEALIRASAGSLLIRVDFFDRFEKGDKTSLAYRLVFQSFEKTLTDEEANTAMGKVHAALKAKGFEIR